MTAIVSLGRGKAGGPFQETAPPTGLDWDFWLGQASAVPYIPERCHKSFRWWFEYAGGEVTNWGAHHLDIAQWGLGAENTGPVEIEGQGVFDERPNCYNTAQKFDCTLKFANGNTIILTSGKDGILFEGEKEHIYVNRGRITGNLVTNMTAEMQSQIDAELAKLYSGPLGKLDEEILTCNEFTKEQFLAVDVGKSHGKFRQLHPGGRPADLGRSDDSSHDQFVPPREHRYASGAETALGPCERRFR